MNNPQDIVLIVASGSWTPVIGLIGVAIGGILTVGTQWMSQRVQLRQQRSAQHETRRAERLTRLIQFFEVAQEAERVAVERLRAISLTYILESGEDIRLASSGEKRSVYAEVERAELDRDWLHLDSTHDAEWRQRADRIQDRLWVAQKTLHMLCSPALTNAARTFAYSIDDLIWHGPGSQDVPDYLRPSRNAFLDAAREDLDRDL